MNDNLTTNASNEAESHAFLVASDTPSCLHLSLKTKWFEMTKAGVKTEDYREINEYWVKSFLYHKESKLTIEEIIRYIKTTNIMDM
jgi:hypothetical protein